MRTNQLLLLLFLLNMIVFCVESVTTEFVDCEFNGEDMTSIRLLCYTVASNVSDCKTNLLLQNQNNEARFHVKILETLYCKGDLFNDTLFDKFPKLEKLVVSSYKFVDFTIAEEKKEHLNTLKILIASNNRLSELRQSYLHPMTALTEVDFSRNKIRWIDKFTSKMLTLINLSQNNISDLSDNVFLELDELKSLDLSFNQIKTISDKLFINNKNLEILLLQNNHINHFGCTEIFKNMYSLNIANNQQMDTLKLLQHLETNRLWSLNLTGIQLDENSVRIISSKLYNVNYIGISFDMLSCQSLTMIAERWRQINGQIIRNLVEECKSKEKSFKTRSAEPTLQKLNVSPSTETVIFQNTSEASPDSTSITTENSESILQKLNVSTSTKPIIFEALPESTTDSPQHKRFDYGLFAISFSSVLAVLWIALAIWYFTQKSSENEDKSKIELNITNENIFESVRIKPDDDFI